MAILVSGARWPATALTDGALHLGECSSTPVQAAESVLYFYLMFEYALLPIMWLANGTRWACWHRSADPQPFVI